MKTVVYVFGTLNVVRVVEGEVSFSDIKDSEDIASLEEFNSWLEMSNLPLIK